MSRLPIRPTNISTPTGAMSSGDAPFSRASASSAAALPTTALFATNVHAADSKLSKGDAAILRFLAAAEIIESDLWQQYNELGACRYAMGNKLSMRRRRSPKSVSKASMSIRSFSQWRSAAVQTEGLCAMRGAATIPTYDETRLAIGNATGRTRGGHTGSWSQAITEGSCRQNPGFGRRPADCASARTPS
jgi:hypothetical protein